MYGCAGSSLLLGLLSSCAERWLLSVAGHGLLTTVAAAVWSTGAGAHRPGSCGAWMGSAVVAPGL